MGPVTDRTEAVLGRRRPLERAVIEAAERSESDGPAGREERRLQLLNSMPVWSNYVTLDQPLSESPVKG